MRDTDPNRQQERREVRATVRAAAALSEAGRHADAREETARLHEAAEAANERAFAPELPNHPDPAEQEAREQHANALWCAAEAASEAQAEAEEADREADPAEAARLREASRESTAGALAALAVFEGE